MSDNVEQLKTLSNGMLRDFLDHDHVQHTCHKVTLNTLGWTARSWDIFQEENAMKDLHIVELELYYATLSNVQSKVLSYMLDGLFHPNTPEK